MVIHNERICDLINFAVRFVYVYFMLGAVAINPGQACSELLAVSSKGGLPPKWQLLQVSPHYIELPQWAYSDI